MTPAGGRSSYETPIGVGIGVGFSRGDVVDPSHGSLVAVTAARDALRELAFSAVAERERKDEACAKLRADVTTLKARLAEANGRCAKRGAR